MFTVKIRFPEGNENLFEARRVEYIENAIVADDGSGKIETMPGLLIHYEDGGCTHYGREEKPRNISVWVTNRFGATVATYRL